MKYIFFFIWLLVFFFCDGYFNFNSSATMTCIWPLFAFFFLKKLNNFEQIFLILLKIVDYIDHFCSTFAEKFFILMQDSKTSLFELFICGLIYFFVKFFLFRFLIFCITLVSVWEQNLCQTNRSFNVYNFLKVFIARFYIFWYNSYAFFRNLFIFCKRVYLYGFHVALSSILIELWTDILRKIFTLCSDYQTAYAKATFHFQKNKKITDEFLYVIFYIFTIVIIFFTFLLFLFFYFLMLILIGFLMFNFFYFFSWFLKQYCFKSSVYVLMPTALPPTPPGFWENIILKSALGTTKYVTNSSFYLQNLNILKAHSFLNTGLPSNLNQANSK